SLDIYTLSLHDALPIYTSTAAFTQIGLDGQQINLTKLNSTTDMSRRALRDDMPGIILRTTVRAITRGVTQKQLNDVNPLAGLAVDRKSTRLNSSHVKIS